MPSQPHPMVPDLDTLVNLFYDSHAELGQFTEVTPSQMPADYRGLLAHSKHMTVTVEKFHNSPVNVHVWSKKIEQPHYARKITLSRTSDGQVVQYGIMRINFSYLSPAVQAEIEQEGTPLGRVLIQHHVLRRVHLASLWHVVPGEDLQRLFGLSDAVPTYGRTALIECNSEPAVELLEIVTPTAG